MPTTVNLTGGGAQLGTYLVRSVTFRSYASVSDQTAEVAVALARTSPRCSLALRSTLRSTGSRSTTNGSTNESTGLSPRAASRCSLLQRHIAVVAATFSSPQCAAAVRVGLLIPCVRGWNDRHDNAGATAELQPIGQILETHGARTRRFNFEALDLPRHTPGQIASMRSLLAKPLVAKD